MLAIETQKVFEQLLLEQKLLSSEDLEVLRDQSAKEGKSLVSLVAEQGAISQEDLVRLTAQANKVPYANLAGVHIDPAILKTLSKEVAKNYMAVPFGRIKGKLAVAMLDPTNLQAVDFITRKIGQSITAFMVSEASVDAGLTQYAADVSQEVSDVMTSVESIKGTAAAKQPKGPKLQNLVQDAPITRALNTILDYAAQSHASDIHIEPREKELKIRYRIDGILQDTMTLPKEIEPALISRIKIMSSLKIDEHRIPQDGQFQFLLAGKEIDVRVAIAPVVYGEQVVIRLLDKDATLLTLDHLGIKGRGLRLIQAGIKRPHGMILSTGPTGSGKSTSLYAIINELKNVTINIVTLEDPVEYKMDGVNQIQINPDVGLNFATGLRSVLRQDPNVVMVGEIRDHETADLAVQAALTGHIVLSTLHTNSAAGVLPRLLDMAVEPFLIASTVNTAIGQRLVRRVCPTCVQPYQSTPTETESIKQTLAKVLPASGSASTELKADLGHDNLPALDQNAYTLFKGKGCTECVNGYKGRTGIYEVFAMTGEMEKLLAKHATTSEVQAQAESDGMITMKQDGYLKALNGVTTLEEVARVAADF